MLKELRLIRNLPAALIFVLILNGACQENEPPLITTGDVTDITSTSAAVDGNITDDGGREITGRGLIWSTEPGPDMDNYTGITREDGEKGFFCNLMTGLSPSTTYYVRAYATNSAGTALGEEVRFTTAADPSIVAPEKKDPEDEEISSEIPGTSGVDIVSSTALTAEEPADDPPDYEAEYEVHEDIGADVPPVKPEPVVPSVSITGSPRVSCSNAVWTGRVTDEGGAGVMAKGMIWSRKPNPDLNTYEGITRDGEGRGIFESILENLAPDTTYYLRAWAVNSAGISMTDQVSFTTAAEVPSVTTGNITRVTMNSFGIAGQVTDEGSSAVRVRGVIYGTQPDPDLYTSRGITHNGSGTGTFSSNVGGLQPGTTYYVRAYATNDRGTTYGNTASFTTIDRCGTDVSFEYRGETVTYGTVEGHNGTCWMDRNLGAFRVAGSPEDVEAFGDLFQWGRPDDGHQDPGSEITHRLSNTSRPGHNYFISVSSQPYNWLASPNATLWQGVRAANNVCPPGWRIPASKEWQEEISSWNSQNRSGAFDSNLKLPAAGLRSSDNSLKDLGSRGYYWSSDANGSNAYILLFSRWSVSTNISTRAPGRSVRCIREEELKQQQTDLVTHP